MNTYENLKIVITGGKKSKDDLLAMMDVFLMRGRITMEQYNELFDMLPADPTPEEPLPVE
jgi:hypothetical protein